MKNKSPVPVFLYIDIDKTSRVEALVKNIRAAHFNKDNGEHRESEVHVIEPLAVFSMELDKENSKFFIAYPSLHSTSLPPSPFFRCSVVPFFRFFLFHFLFFMFGNLTFVLEEVTVSSLMGTPLSIKALESFAWHMSKAIVHVIRQYPNMYS